MQKKLTQLQLVYNYMVAGNTLDRKTAMQELHVENLTARISELRALGLWFSVRYYEGSRIAYYFMTDTQVMCNDSFYTLEEIIAIRR